MDQPEEQAPVVFIIECVGVTECRVSFEPEGGSTYSVKTTCFESRRFLRPAHTSRSPTAMTASLLFWAERAFNKAGKSYSCSSTSIRVAFRPDRDTR